MFLYYKGIRHTGGRPTSPPVPTPLFGCVPLCFFFFVLVITGVIMYLAGAGGVTLDGSPQPPVTPSDRPPYWVFPVALLIAAAALLLLSLVTDG